MGDDASFRENDKAFACLQRIDGVFYRIEFAFQTGTIDRNVKFAVHITEQWYFFHLALAHKNSVHRSEPHCWNIQIGEMIGAKDVLLSRTQWRATVYFEWQENKNEKQPRPPAVENPHELKLFWKNDRNQQEGKQGDEEDRKNSEAISRV